MLEQPIVVANGARDIPTVDVVEALVFVENPVGFEVVDVEGTVWWDPNPLNGAEVVSCSLILKSFTTYIGKEAHTINLRVDVLTDIKLVQDIMCTFTLTHFAKSTAQQPVPVPTSSTRFGLPFRGAR